MAEALGPSLWVDTAPGPQFPVLTGEHSFDVAIVGGGIVGVLTTYYLAKAGLRVCLIEARRLTGQVTGGTTAKITALHGLIYGQLAGEFGEQGARTYGEANQWAIDEVRRLVAEHAIDCALVACPAVTYTESPQQVDAIRQEVEQARRLGLAASFTTETELPFPVAAAIRLDDQASFHPCRFLLPIADAAVAAGAAIFEDSRVLDMDEGPQCRVTTASGRVIAGQVVVATNLPILDRGGHFARAFPRRHLALAAELDGPAPQGMYLSVDTPSRSVRGYEGGNGPVLVAIGDGFKTAHADSRSKIDELEQWVRERFPVRSVGWRWGNQDYYSADHLPFIGRLTALSRHTWTATGFGGWGMSNGVVAARIITDGITGRHNSWASLFNAHRFDLQHGTRTLLEQNVHVAKEWIGDRLTRPDPRSPADIQPGDHAVTTIDGDRTGLYRDHGGILHAVAITCTHMGCILRFNDMERSWDCPCHGSRFDVDGDVLQGPAVKKLARKSV